jgi:hypothetical protein
LRRTILVTTLLFLAMLAALTVWGLINNGVTPVSVISIMILIFFWIGIVGALRTPPRE